LCGATARSGRRTQEVAAAAAETAKGRQRQEQEIAARSDQQTTAADQETPEPDAQVRRRSKQDEAVSDNEGPTNERPGTTRPFRFSTSFSGNNQWRREGRSDTLHRANSSVRLPVRPCVRPVRSHHEAAFADDRYRGRISDHRSANARTE